MERVELFISFLEGEAIALNNVIKKIKSGKDNIDDDDRETLNLFYDKFKELEDGL